MLMITNNTNNILGPYNGVVVSSNGSVNLVGAIAPYISDGALITDVISESISVTFAGKQSTGANAAALLMQLGQLFNTDSDGANLSRVKQAPTGWTYQLRGFEFTTANLNSLQNKDQNNIDLTDIMIKYFDSNGSELFLQSDLDNLCVKTQIDFEPHFDYYLIGGEAKTLVTPVNDTRISVVGVPDYPAPNGSKVMIQNVNMKYIGPGDKVSADGRASKGLLYNNPIPHTNKIRFSIFHSIGDKVSFGLCLELYKI